MAMESGEWRFGGVGGAGLVILSGTVLGFLVWNGKERVPEALGAPQIADDRAQPPPGPLRKDASRASLVPTKQRRLTRTAGSDTEGRLMEEEDPSLVRAISEPIGSIAGLPVARDPGEWVNRGPRNYDRKAHDLAGKPPGTATLQRRRNTAIPDRQA